MSKPQSILVSGSTGQVGSEIVAALATCPSHTILAPTRAELDLASESSIRACLRAHQPRWILNPAAYTAVDRAESEPALAQAINADAPRILGEEAAALGAAVLHFSTDYVFDGAKPTPYIETDPTNPLSVYGRTKLAGEQALAATGAAHIILRTSWVYGATGKNFLLTILRLASERPELKIVADQHGAPTWSRSLATLAAHIVTQYTPATLPSGVYHATSQGDTTWHGFASAAVRRRNLPARILPIPTSGYPTPAVRPANSRLNCDKLAGTFGARLPDWQSSLDAVLKLIAE